jgi:hypothetical protein
MKRSLWRRLRAERSDFGMEAVYTTLEPQSWHAGTMPQSHNSDLRIPNAKLIPFGSYNNKYAGRTCYVIGRGPTSFDYTSLSQIAEPVFFINDAICMEKYAGSETFFFAHDIELRVWFDGSMKSTAVIPGDHTVLGHTPPIRVLGHLSPVVFYDRPENGKWDLLQMSRDEIALRQQLFTLAGTMHSLLHFVWFCGFRRVNLIGCDGTNLKTDPGGTGSPTGGYDPRLANRSQSTPMRQYREIRMAQDLLINLFRLEAVYFGTP